MTFLISSQTVGTIINIFNLFNSPCRLSRAVLGLHRPRRRLQRGHRLLALHGRQGEESTRGPRTHASKDSRFLPNVGQFPELVRTRTGRREKLAEIELHLRQLVS